jgi:hypothetical protein
MGPGRSLAATLLAHLLVAAGVSHAQPSAPATASPAIPVPHGGFDPNLDSFAGDADAPLDPRYAGILLDPSLLPTPSSLRVTDLASFQRDQRSAELRAEDGIFRLPSLGRADARELGLTRRAGYPQPLPLFGSPRLSWGVTTYDPFTRGEDKTLGSLLFDLKDASPVDRRDRWSDTVPEGGLILYFTLHGSSGSR